MRRAVTCIALTMLICGCSEDHPNEVTNSTPPPDTASWREVGLDLAAGNSRVVAVDFTANHGLAMAVLGPEGGLPSELTHQFFRLQPDGRWLADSLGAIRSGFVARDLALDTTGKVVLVGVQVPGPPSVILDLRGASPEYVEQDSYGMWAVDGEGSFMVAGGWHGSGGGLWTSTGPGAWSFDDLPLTGAGESGFMDVYVRGNHAVAYGQDDGAQDTLQVILSRTATTSWRKIPPDGFWSWSPTCIALNGSGVIYVGGIEGAGGTSPEAYLARRSADGHWTDVTLPDRDQLRGVMDILIADDNSVYLACCGEGDKTQANLVHVRPSGARKEITSFPGGLLQIDQSAGGPIYAVGFRRDEATGAVTGVMLVKVP